MGEIKKKWEEYRMKARRKHTKNVIMIHFRGMAYIK